MEHFMTSEEVAELLHVDPVTIRRLVSKGDLSAYRIGADYRFAPSDLQDYLQRQRVSARARNFLTDSTGSRNGPVMSWRWRRKKRSASSTITLARSIFF